MEVNIVFLKREYFDFGLGSPAPPPLYYPAPQHRWPFCLGLSGRFAHEWSERRGIQAHMRHYYNRSLYGRAKRQCKGGLPSHPCLVAFTNQATVRTAGQTVHKNGIRKGCWITSPLRNGICKGGCSTSRPYSWIFRKNKLKFESKYDHNI